MCVMYISNYWKQNYIKIIGWKVKTLSDILKPTNQVLIKVPTNERTWFEKLKNLTTFVNSNNITINLEIQQFCVESLFSFDTTK